MKPALASLINAVVLISFGLWGYFGSETPSVTALIPVWAGLVLLSINYWFWKGNKVVAHIAVLLTLLILIGLIKPLTAAFGRDDAMAVFRVIAMMVASIKAMYFFVLSFINARRKP